MKSASVSHVGRRETNDDVVFTGDRLVVLADGMGGHEGGQQAAQAAVGAALRHLTTRTENAVREAFVAANAAVREYQLSAPDHPEAGCTLIVVAIREVPAIGWQAIVGHVGDSPAFLIRDGEMVLLTPPHTAAEQLRREGRITDEEATTHPGRHTLQQSIGARPDVEPDIRSVDVEAGDRLLICSDGLLDVPDRRELRDLATGQGELDKIVASLAEAALATSGDNVTVAMMVVQDGDGFGVTRSD